MSKKTTTNTNSTTIMESYEATKAVFSRIQAIDPQNASKIMGYILIHYTEKDMIRFAHGPETLLISVTNKAKTQLPLSSNTLPVGPRPTGSSPIAISRHYPLSYGPVNPSFSPNGSSFMHDFCEFDDPLGKSFDLYEQRSDCFRGFCKNGSVDFCDNNAPCGGDFVGSPCKFDVFEQRIAAQLMNGGMNLPCNNKLNFLQSESQRSAAALLMDEEFYKLNRVRMARNDFAGLDSNSVSRQIYLTFPADSTFKEEDVSSYFNLYGPVQDVRIPYQQKRMFGFVTFLYPETVKLILAKGNPHFVCDSRVLVKPYKEKSKLPDKKLHQQPLERGEFFQGSSPLGPEYRDPYDFHFRGRMLYSTKDMLFRKKLDEVDLQQALELEERRLMSLRLHDLKNYQNQRNTSVGSPIFSPRLAQVQSSQMLSNGFVQDVFKDNSGSPNGVFNEQVGAEGVNATLSDCNGNDQSNEDDNKPKTTESELSESDVEHILPDNLFASPKKSASKKRSSLFLPEFGMDDAVILSTSSATSSELLAPASSMLSLPPHKSCFFEMPRLPTGQGALGL